MYKIEWKVNSIRDDTNLKSLESCENKNLRFVDVCVFQKETMNQKVNECYCQINFK